MKGYFLVGYHLWCTFKFVQVVSMVENFVNFSFCNKMQTQDTFFNSQQRKGHESSMTKLKHVFKLSSLSFQTIKTNKKRWLMFVTKMVHRQATIQLTFTRFIMAWTWEQSPLSSLLLPVETISKLHFFLTLPRLGLISKLPNYESCHFGGS